MLQNKNQTSENRIFFQIFFIAQIQVGQQYSSQLNKTVWLLPERHGSIEMY